MYRLLALDLDGTLLRRDGTIDPRDREAVAELRAQGVEVTLVTGRLYAGSQHVAAELALEAPVACADGAQLVDPTTGQEIEHHGIVGEAAAVVRETLQDCPAATFLLFDDQVIFDQRGQPFSPFVQAWSPALEQVEQLFEHPAWDSARGLSGVVAVSSEASVRDAAQALRRDDRIEVFDFVSTNAPGRAGQPPIHALLAHAAGVSKGRAIVEIAERCGCTPAEVVAVGDWLNDVDMFAAVGRSFAMAQSPQAVCQAATDQLVSEAHKGGGVAEAIRRAWPQYSERRPV